MSDTWAGRGESPMAKSFDPKGVEEKWATFWSDHDLFHADVRSTKPPFVMVIPPPNITGRLHVGHGLNNALQDILARWKRMSGHDVLWIPGSDHASIATHVMIERQLESEGLTRQQLGREAFLERAWAWKQRFGSEIVHQLRQLGASCDWSRERFTMDSGLSHAVREVFVRLYEEGLIYRGRYLINWCPRCRTAVSDLEVVHKETEGRLYTIRYPLEGRGEIRVATTRPETILGDAAVAVHPDDPRYKAMVGRTVLLPVLGRAIPIVADAYVDPAFGTGAVKVTPAHDPKDFDAGKRLGLEPIVVMDEGARMTAAAGPYAGLDRFACRSALLERLEKDGLLVGSEAHRHAVGHCQRCDTVVEPMISLQWFVKMAPLAAPALAAVEQGRIELIPDQWRKTYNEWLGNIRDWCISRQLWWGHRIPAWYCDRCNVTLVARKDPEACAKCAGPLRQDPDILDTWFSSGLWAFSTMGWPEKTADLARYYPTHVLVTGYDIVFFWVARMVMLSLKFMGEVPFRKVFFNGLVRDEHGEKISKTKGNVIDLFDLLDRYGADAVRFTYAALTTPGSDVALAPGRLEGSRNFANKMWNVVRFSLPHLQARTSAVPPSQGLTTADRWILSRSSVVAGEVSRALESYRFDEAADAIYHFAWHEVCDWYIEIIKIRLSSGRDDLAEPARATLAHVLDRLLKMLHPFMPFLTEELWQALPRVAAKGPVNSLSVASFPVQEPQYEDPVATRAIGMLMEVVTLRRNLQAGLRGVTGPVQTLVAPFTPEAREALESLREELRVLTRSSDVRIVATLDGDVTAVRGVTADAEVALPLAKLDVEAERQRLRGEIERAAGELAGHDAKLSNDSFLTRAKPDAVDKVKRAHRELTDRIAKLKTTLAQLEG